MALSHPAGENSRVRTLLWVNVRLLHPLTGGDRIRTYHMLRHLRKYCRIHYVCPVTEDDTAEVLSLAGEYCDELTTYPHDLIRSQSWRFYASALRNACFGKRPFSCEKYDSRKARALIRSLLERTERPDLVVADYLMSYVHFDGQTRSSDPPLIVFQHNLESLIWQRHTKAAANPLKRFVYSRERDLTRSFENQVALHADGQIAVSAEEADVFQNHRGMKNVLGWVPTGVDCEYFTPAQNSEPATMAFLGSMDWHANVEAIHHFVKNSYPAIQKAVPESKLLLIGRNPHASLRALAEADPSIEFTGTVADVRPYLARASIMILPLRVGGGTRIKVFEGMAAGLAVVSSRIGVEGLPVENGVHALIEDEPSAFSDAVIGLMRDHKGRSDLIKTAREWVKSEFSWDRAARRFLELSEPILDKSK